MAECNCNTNSPLPMPKDIVDLKTPLFHACGGRLYRLNLEMDASSIMMGGQDVATRINSLERALQANTSTHFADTIAQRNQLGGLVAGDYCYVFDASADPSVGKGPAMYIWMPGSRWVKLYNGESPIDCVNLIAPGGGLAIDASGKIYVDFSKAPAATIRQLTSYIYKNGGGLAVDDDGRLFVDLSALVAPKGGLKVLAGKLAVNAADIASPNAGLATDADGRLRVDFSAMPAEQMRAVVLSMVQAGGGIGVDQSGKLYVDFGAMPTDKFEAMMKALRLPIWLTANKTFYVDGVNGIAKPANGVWPDGIGESEAKAFRKIQDCVDYVANNYNLGDYRALISIASHTYEENLTLPEFSRQKGYMELAARTWNPADVVVKAANPRENAVAVSGGSYRLSCLGIDWRGDVASLAEDRTGTYVALLKVNAGSCLARGCHFRFAPAGGNPARKFICYGLQASDTGMLTLGPVSGYQNSIETGFDLEDANYEFYCLTASNGGILQANGSNDDNASPEILVNVLNEACAFASGGSVNFASGHVAKPTVKAFGQGAEHPTGFRYKAINGGTILTHNGSAEFFPGQKAGTAEASTYSWCK